MICFNVLKEFIVFSSVLFCLQPPDWSLVVSSTYSDMVAYTMLPYPNSITPRPFICFIYLEGMRELSTPGYKASCNSWIPHTHHPFLFSSSFLSAVQLLLPLHMPWREKPGIPLSDWGAPWVVDNSHGVGAVPCCYSCRAVSLICGHSCSLAALVIFAHIDGWWIDSGR